MSFEGVAIGDKETINRLMSEKRWGDAVRCSVLRDGREQPLLAYLRRQPPKTERATRPSEPKIVPGSMPPSAIPGMPPGKPQETPPKPPTGGSR